MRKLLSLWHAVPRGGQLSRSVWTRLLLLVCMLSATQGLWAAETATFTKEANLQTGTTANKVGVITLSLPSSNGFTKSNDGLYAGGSGFTFTLTADEGYVIKSIVMTKTTNSNRFNSSSNAPSGTTITENNTTRMSPSFNMASGLNRVIDNIHPIYTFK